MRIWRKLYSSVLDSQQVASLSDGAVVLLTLLIAAQDDVGYYPWSAAKVRRLTASRPDWNMEKAEVFAGELVDTGIAAWQDGGLVLLNGETLNGNPRSTRPPDVYQRQPTGTHLADTGPPPGTHLADTGSHVVAIEQSRVEQSRVEQSRAEQSCNLVATWLPGGDQVADTAAAAFQAYKSNIGMLTPHIADQLRDMIDGQHALPEWIVEAIEIAVEHNARSLAYVKRIIERWLTEGKDDGRTPANQRGRPRGGAKRATKPSPYAAISIVVED